MKESETFSYTSRCIAICYRIRIAKSVGRRNLVKVKSTGSGFSPSSNMFHFFKISLCHNPSFLIVFFNKLSTNKSLLCFFYTIFKEKNHLYISSLNVYIKLHKTNDCKVLFYCIIKLTRKNII